VVQNKANPSKYHLGYKVLQIAGAYLEDLDLWQVARPTMEQLSRRFNETVKLWVLDDVEVVYLGRVIGPGPLQSVLPVGSRGFLHSRAVGKAILAHLPPAEVTRIAQTSGLERRTDRTITRLDQLQRDLEQVRQRGYAVSDQEDVEGLCAVGAAILNLEGKPIGGLVMSNLAARMTEEYIKTLGQALAEACRQISRQLGYPGLDPDDHE
jgi:DNA-binding IclR family transcriptional regulator